jgi:inosine-uridine nucleoside N-ribohydrolase
MVSIALSVIWVEVGKFKDYAPLTNLAAAETKSPGILKKAKESAIVRGTFFCSANVTLHAEFNIWFNAEAAQTVFDRRDDLVEKGKSPS